MDWLVYEKNLTKSGYKCVCGIDEAGRGPLAGPVFAAAVVLPENVVIEGVNDSKKLSEKKREVLFEKIKTTASAYCISSASVEEIEEVNILNATFMAMRRAFDGLKKHVEPDFALIDGNRSPELPVKSMPIVKGDSCSESIAAASILAKVSRDRLMCELAAQYPQYFFEKHKGYGTKLHVEMIKKYGPTPVHRLSFLKKII